MNRKNVKEPASPIKGQIHYETNPDTPPRILAHPTPGCAFLDNRENLKGLPDSRRTLARPVFIQRLGTADRVRRAFCVLGRLGIQFIRAVIQKLKSRRIVSWKFGAIERGAGDDVASILRSKSKSNRKKRLRRK